VNKQPICDNPITGSMETLSGYRLCCNPAHDGYRYGMAGPVWHLISEWPPNLPKEQLNAKSRCASPAASRVRRHLRRLEAFEAWWSAMGDEYEDDPHGAAKAAWFREAE
jgi:hypothetical protein